MARKNTKKPQTVRDLPPMLLFGDQRELVADVISKWLESQEECEHGPRRTAYIAEVKETYRELTGGL